MIANSSPSLFLPSKTILHQDDEDNELAKSMMGKKTKRLYGRMQHGIQAKNDVVDALETKRKAVDDAEHGRKNAPASAKGSKADTAKKQKR